MIDCRVAIIVLNWNGWRDTIECLESLQKLNYSNYRIIVVDNASSDGSAEKIKDWASGKLATQSPFVEYDSSHKPLHWVEYCRAVAESGGDRKDETVLASTQSNKGIVLIQSGRNLGFAGGNNVGIRYAMANNFDYVWILNNDTVVHPDSLAEMVKRMQEKPSAGICGSTLLYYHRPNSVQALGGASYNKWLATSSHIGAHSNYSKNISIEEIENKIDYIVGASMLVSRQFIEDIGILCEEYFLYYEEIDWATRAKGKYRLAYAAKSIVYHKEGNSIGSNMEQPNKSMTADYFSLRNRVQFTRKYYKYFLPTIYLGLLIAIINRVRRRQLDRVKLILKIICQNSGDYPELDGRGRV